MANEHFEIEEPIPTSADELRAAKRVRHVPFHAGMNLAATQLGCHVKGVSTADHAMPRKLADSLDTSPSRLQMQKLR